MRLGELLAGAGIKCPQDSENIEISDICTSSKEVSRGSLFICIDGLHTDGHRFAADAVRAGAAAIVAQDKERLQGIVNVPIVETTDTRAASAYLYAAFYGGPQNKLKIIGVTGTNGKTTVTAMIYKILKEAGIRCGLIGTVGCLAPSGKLDIRSSNGLANMTTPDPPELYRILSAMEKDGAKYVVMEVTSHALALSKVAPISFCMAVFTNLTEDHLDFHGDMENYFAAKAGLFKGCDCAVVNVDDAYGRRLCESFLGKRLITCSGEEREARYLASEIRADRENGIEYKINSPFLRLRVRCGIPGSFTVMNSLEAVAVATEIGVSAGDIKSALSSLSGVSGRLEKILPAGVYKSDFSVFIDYAHTPDALENLLRAASGFKKRGQRIVLLFGCGGDRDRYKRKLMGQIASRMADFTIVTSDNSRSEEPREIISEILKGIDKESRYTVIENRREAIEYAIKNARRGDIILLAGKGHENYEIDAEGKRPFCEKDIVTEAYEKYHM